MSVPVTRQPAPSGGDTAFAGVAGRVPWLATAIDDSAQTVVFAYTLKGCGPTRDNQVFPASRATPLVTALEDAHQYDGIVRAALDVTSG